MLIKERVVYSIDKGPQLGIKVSSLKFPLKKCLPTGTLSQSLLWWSNISTKEARETSIEKGATKLRKLYVPGKNFPGPFRKLIGEGSLL